MKMIVMTLCQLFVIWKLLLMTAEGRKEPNNSILKYGKTRSLLGLETRFSCDNSYKIHNYILYNSKNKYRVYKVT